MWRRAKIDEDNTIIAMCLGLYKEDPSGHPVPESHMRNTLAELRKETTKGVAVVLDVGGAIAGYALLILFWSNELGGNICVIDELYVTPTYRGQKHATQLIEQLASDTAFFQQRPVAFEVEVTPRNKRARALYSRLGFNPAPNARLRKSYEALFSR